MKSIKQFLTDTLIGILMALLIIIASAWVMGCCSIDREDYPNDSCYMAALCSCRHDDNPAVCSKAWEGCNSANVEKQRINRLTFCKSQYKDYDFSSKRECYLELNQKGQ